MFVQLNIFTQLNKHFDLNQLENNDTSGSKESAMHC